ncbi:MAG: hypothetical protein AVDCRST_MAG19-1146 [uncultured Thermomicrobiales bacterium]|uniref:Uncharacterized protein n=1 Tax=uncultured Thermomicrobiales bacterium TaxID=1645740 RepID=A0A6J4UQR0_9BACT|nr:MAG: hypothetical protein AVDCRST_MAG19-1146 [uncultured Thermomicrobiales bacterium]
MPFETADPPHVPGSQPPEGRRRFDAGSPREATAHHGGGSVVRPEAAVGEPSKRELWTPGRRPLGDPSAPPFGQGIGPASVEVAPSTTAIAIPGEGKAAPYPSTIEVSGVAGGIADLDVVLRGFKHVFPSDVDVLLVGPGGQSAVVMSDVGVGVGVTNLTLSLDDQADAGLPTNAGLTSGRFKPTNYSPGYVDLFPDAAP